MHSSRHIPSKRSLLWIIDFDYSQRNHSGAYLRFFNIAEALLAQGHSVYFLVAFTGSHTKESRQYFQSLKERGVFCDFVEHTWMPLPKLRGIPLLLSSPRSYQEKLGDSDDPFVKLTGDYCDRHAIDTVLISSRRALYCMDKLPRSAAIAIDICDCIPLVLSRQLRVELRNGRFASCLRILRDLQKELALESYFCRRSTLNLVVSDVDRRALDRVTFGRANNQVLPNGVITPSLPSLRKHPKRIIFSGAMSFPPNVEAAVWFVKNVWPIVLARHPDASFVLAGAKPSPEVLALANESVSVTGYVEDLSAEIARSSLYVAPLISGSGFRNKVVEALAAGTMVVTTRMGTEFLPEWLQQELVEADSPKAMAASICDLLDRPKEVADQIERLTPKVVDYFQWSRSAERLIELLEPHQRKLGSPH